MTGPRLRVAASAGSRRSRLHALLTAAGSFLLEPPDGGNLTGLEPRAAGETDDRAVPRNAAHPGPQAVAVTRPVIAVFGLARGCGSSMVSRAVAAELAARDASGTAAVACESAPRGLPLATNAAARLARALDDMPGGARALGRLCLLRGADPSALADALRALTPLVIDAGSSSLGGAPACVADRTLIVTTPAVEPTLARVAIECVARVGPEPTLVLNRALQAGERAEAPVGTGGPAAPAVTLPESRLVAQLVLGGREARGRLGRSVARLVDGWEGGG